MAEAAIDRERRLILPQDACEDLHSLLAFIVVQAPIDNGDIGTISQIADQFRETVHLGFSRVDH